MKGGGGGISIPNINNILYFRVDKKKNYSMLMKFQKINIIIIK